MSLEGKRVDHIPDAGPFTPVIAILRRELLTGLRTPLPFYFLGAFMFFLIVGLLLLLEIVYRPQIERGGIIDANLVAALFEDFSRCLYLSAVLLVPPMAAISICVERQQDSYDLLQMTYIRPLALSLAKLANVLGIYFLIMIATMPFVGVTFFLIGIDWTQFVLTFSLIFLSACSLSVIGLLCSARFYRTLPAIVFTYVLGYAAQGGLLVAAGLVTELVAPGTRVSSMIRFPPEAVYLALSPFHGIETIGNRGSGLHTVLYMLLYHGTLIGIGLYLVMRTLRHPPGPTGMNSAPLIDHHETLARRRARFPYYLIDPRRRHPPIPDGRNPVLARELRASVLSQGSPAVRLFYGFAVFTFLVSLVCMDLYGKHNQIAVMAGWTFLYVTFFLVLLAPALIATSVAREWEWQNIDNLRSTLIPARAILWGKYHAGLRTLSIAVAGAAAGSFPLFIFGRDGWAVWHASALGLGAMIVCVVYALAVSLWATVNSRRSMTALLVAYGACGTALVLVPPAAIILIRATIARFYTLADEAPLYSFLSPLTAFQIVVNRAHPDGMAAQYAYWLANCLFFLAVTGILLYASTRRFVRLIEKE